MFNSRYFFKWLFLNSHVKFFLGCAPQKINMSEKKMYFNFPIKKVYSDDLLSGVVVSP